MSAIQEKITENTRTVLEDSRREKIPPRDAAVRLALKRVRRAMEMRRWGAISQSRPELR
jgi:glutamate dehydrogenase (NAD(P)+)